MKNAIPVSRAANQPSKAPAAAIGGHERLVRLDEIRGLTLISMMLYHFLWDLVYIAGIPIPWYRSAAAHLWQQSICWTFILLSGFCWSFGSRPLKRGLTVFLSGGVVTVATLIFLPEDKVVFGVLTLLGSCTLLMIPLNRLFERVTGRFALIGCFAAATGLFFLLFDVNDRPLWVPEGLYANYFTAYLGFPMPSFRSTDYFALIPWFFLFLMGYFLHRCLFTADREPGVLTRAAHHFLRTGTIPFAPAIGRRSLLLYLLHQPVLYGITLVIIHFAG